MKQTTADGAGTVATAKLPDLEKAQELDREQQRTAEKFGEVPGTASQDRRLQRTGEQAFVDRAEADEIALRKWFEGMCEQFGVHEMAKLIKAGRKEINLAPLPEQHSPFGRLG